MNERTAVITGAAGGLGQAIARHLLAAGFRIIPVTRDQHSAQTALRNLLPHDRLTTAPAFSADLLDLDGIHALADRLHSTVDRIDVLVNNAGAAFAAYGETSAGAERTHAVNHLAPFLLTHLLLDRKLLGSDARIINISTDLIRRGRVSDDDPDVLGTSWRDRYRQTTVYATSKLISMLATFELATRLPPGMSAYSASPGIVRTSFTAKAGGVMRLTSAVASLLAAPPSKAAQTPVSLATTVPAPTPNGGYFARSTATPPAGIARNAHLAAEIYRRTAEALAITVR